MAYVSKDLMKKVRENVKKAFPSKDGWKITCKRSSSFSSVTATIRKAPDKFHDELKSICVDEVSEVYSSLSKHHVTDNAYLNEVHDKLEDCLMTDEYYNRSDVMTDYFDYSHYYDMYVGEYEKPFQLSA